MGPVLTQRARAETRGSVLPAAQRATYLALDHIHAIASYKPIPDVSDFNQTANSGTFYCRLRLRCRDLSADACGAI